MFFALRSFAEEKESFHFYEGKQTKSASWILTYSSSVLKNPRGYTASYKYKFQQVKLEAPFYLCRNPLNVHTLLTDYGWLMILEQFGLRFTIIEPYEIWYGMMKLGSAFECQHHFVSRQPFYSLCLRHHVWILNMTLHHPGTLTYDGFLVNPVKQFRVPKWCRTFINLPSRCTRFGV
jgi:hypothetical protein